VKALWQSVYLFGLKPLRSAGPESRAWVAHAARGGRSLRRAWWALVSVAFVALLAGQAAGGTWLAHWHLWEEHPDSLGMVLEDLLDDEYLWTYVTAWGVAAAVTLLELCILRLIWLRLGAKRALRRRDRCVECGHGLAGVPLMQSGEVRCPECASATPAVVAWNEIECAAPDRAVFRPAEGLLTPFWTKARLTLGAKVCAAVLLLGAFGYGGWRGVREIGIRRQAEVAIAERPGSQLLNTMIREGIPERVDDRPLASDLVQQIAASARTLESEYRAQQLAGVTDAERINVAPDWIPKRLNGDESAEDLLSIHHSRLLVALMRDAGLFQQIDAISDADPWSMPTYVGIDEDAAQIAGKGDLRRVLRICIARMRLAREVGDVDEYGRAMRSAVVLTNFAYSGPFLIDWLIAASCESMVIAEANFLLQQPRGEAWTDVVEREVQRLRPRPASRAFEIERLYVLDTLAWYFSDVSRVRKGRSAPELEDKLGIGGALDFRRFFGGSEDDAPSRLGTYTENRDAAKIAFDRLEMLARTEPWQRGSIPPDTAAPADLLIVYQFMSPMEQVLKSADQAELRRRALRVMLALERHRLARGAYPDSLSDLPPSSAGATVLDPYSGKPFRYRRTDPAHDAFGRGYLLWTVGLDGIDNGGDAEARTWDTPLRPAGEGMDMILNDPRW